MKTVMKIYVGKGSILPGEESEAENNQTNKKDLSTYLTTEEKVQWEEVAPRNQAPEKREQ